MEFNEKSTRELLATLLDSQLEPLQATPVDQQRLRAALTDGPELTAAEQRALLLSPVARSDYLRLRRRIRQTIEQRWRNHDFKPYLVAKAAADNSTVINYLAEDASFRITLYQQADDDMPWMLLLSVEATLLGTLHPMTQVRLIDSGGLEWVRGRLDARGEISFGWYDLSNEPDQRLREHMLTLEVA